MFCETEMAIHMYLRSWIHKSIWVIFSSQNLSFLIGTQMLVCVYNTVCSTTQCVQNKLGTEDWLSPMTKQEMQKMNSD